MSSLTFTHARILRVTTETYQRYLFEYAESAVLIMDTTGRATGETDAIRTSRAAMNLSGRDATAVLRPDTELPHED